MKITDILGEATEYDKKQAVERKKVKNWLKSISAFANTAGGILIFGVTNDEEIVGLEELKSDSEFVSQKIKERISPYSYEDFSFSKLRERYKSWTGNSMTEKSFESFGIRDEQGHLTNAGALLADVFARLGYMERQGSGLSKICTAYENASNYQPGMEPIFRSNRVEFTVKLPNLNFKASSDEALNEALNGALTKNQKMLLDILRSNPTITQQEIIVNTSLSRSTVQRTVKELTEMGRLERVGSKKTGSWIVKA